MIAPVDYQKSPFLIIWEMTQACALACRHCRADAHPGRHPAELSTAEGEELLRQAALLGAVVVVLSGGDPLLRPDLYHLVRVGASLGLRMATIPAATPRLTRDVMDRLKESGLSQVALSLDFPHADGHDRFRGVRGVFDRSLKAAAWARAAGLPLQINTTVCGESAPFVEEMPELLERLGVVFWELFFLVPMGRGTVLEGLDAAWCERMFERLYDIQRTSSFLVKVTEAPHYRRYVAEREREDGGATAAGLLPRSLRRTEGPGGSIGLAPRGVNAGNGFLFVAHDGKIFPSGFLPLAAGNIRSRSLMDAYRNAGLFRSLRRPETFHGECGRCAYNVICGGSRARAYALTGDPFGSDPWCAGRQRSLKAPVAQ